MSNEAINRDWQETTILFEFELALLKAKKDRIILERDGQGRILKAEVPNYF